VHFYTPVDDTHSWRFDFGFRRTRAVTPRDVHRALIIDENHRRIPSASNHYLQDREKQRTVNFTGMEDFLTHDSCATESMGALFDRSREHLGVSDKGVISVRRFLLDAIRAGQAGEDLPLVTTDPTRNRFPHADCIREVIDGSDWRERFPHLTRGALEGDLAAV
jgi:hypothetical protein